MQKDGRNSECENGKESTGGIDARCHKASDFQGDIFVQGPFSMLKLHKAPISLGDDDEEHGD
jgi:hypothetical protein